MYFTEVPKLDFSVSSLGGLELSSIPIVYSHLSAAGHYLLEQFTAPYTTTIDLRHLMCSSCDADPNGTLADRAMTHSRRLWNQLRDSANRVKAFSRKVTSRVKEEAAILWNRTDRLVRMGWARYFEPRLRPRLSSPLSEQL